MFGLKVQYAHTDYMYARALPSLSGLASMTAMFCGLALIFAALFFLQQVTTTKHHRVLFVPIVIVTAMSCLQSFAIKKRDS